MVTHVRNSSIGEAELGRSGRFLITAFISLVIMGVLKLILLDLMLEVLYI